MYVVYCDRFITIGVLLKCAYSWRVEYHKIYHISHAVLKLGKIMSKSFFLIIHKTLLLFIVKMMDVPYLSEEPICNLERLPTYTL